MPHINAMATFDVTMTGRAAHASMAPEHGANALDALVLGYVGVAVLRQHLRPTEKVHGIVTHGGDQPSVVPSRTTGRFMVRGADSAQVTALGERVRACFEGGARAAGTVLETSRWCGRATRRCGTTDLWRRRSRRMPGRSGGGCCLRPPCR